MNKNIIFYILLIFIAALSSCNPTKHVPENKFMLNKVKIRSDVKTQTEQELKQYLRQTPNSGSFGIFRMRLNIYNISGRDTTKKTNKFFRKIGDAPVVYDESLTEKSELELERYLQNKGYINAYVDSDIKYKKKKANLKYTVHGNKPYKIANYKLSIKNDTILNIIKNDSANSLIRKNMLFDTDVLNAERVRMTNLLRQKGYYNFSKDYFHYLADSTLESNEVNVRLVLRSAVKTENDGSLVSVAQKQYTVRKIKIITYYDPITGINASSLDSVVYGNYVVYFDSKTNIRPSVLISNCHIETNKLYNEQKVEKTYTTLNVLSAIKYVNIRFKEVEGLPYTLDCIILTSPSKPQSYSLDLEGTNSNGDFGFAGIVGYQHKNIFKGSEILKLSMRVARETETGSFSNLLKFTSNEIGGEASVTFPNFLFPFLGSDFRKKIRANTEFNVNYNSQRRPDYSRTIASAGTKYHWTVNKTKRHNIDLIDVSYIYLPSISDAFREKYLNSSSILKYSYENQLILHSGYSISIGNQALRKQRDNIAFRWGFESAGNSLYGISKLFDFKTIDDSYTIGNIKFAQYLKSDIDFAYDKYIDKRNNLVYHIGLGVAFPYGNVNVLPFEKRYIGGGANGVRGWAVRTLGPGLYLGTNEAIDYMNQSGDMQLCMNLEYRFKMIWLIEGALFADAGNIWTLRYYNTQEGGMFKIDEFYKQIAYSYGFGTRFDFSYFIIRIDLGVKAFNPVLENSNRWRFKGLNWSDDFAVHFAVGYPF